MAVPKLKQQGPGELMSIAEVATVFGAQVQTLYRWRHEGKGPRAFKLGGFLRYHRADVEEWIKNSTAA